MIGKLKVAKLLHVAFLAATLVMVDVPFRFAREGIVPFPIGGTSAAHVNVASVMLAISTIVALFSARYVTRAILRNSRFQGRLALAILVRDCFYFSPAVGGLVAWGAGAGQYVVLPFFAGAFAVLVITFPTVRTWKPTLESAEKPSSTSQ